MNHKPVLVLAFGPLAAIASLSAVLAQTPAGDTMA
jgi:hypothetical protein